MEQNTEVAIGFALSAVLAGDRGGSRARAGLTGPATALSDLVGEFAQLGRNDKARWLEMWVRRVRPVTPLVEPKVSARPGFAMEPQLARICHRVAGGSRRAAGEVCQTTSAPARTSTISPGER